MNGDEKCTECGQSHWSIKKGLCRDCDEIRKERIRAAHKAKTNELAEFIPYHNECDYIVDVELKRLKYQFAQYSEDYGGFEYNPDFQRGYVWSQEQKIGYMESFVSNILSPQQRTITLNCPDFTRINKAKDSDLNGFVIVDGLQRTSAINDFIDAKFKIFGKYGFEDLENSKFSLSRKTVKVQVFSWQYKREILEYYLMFNTGGTIHSKKELQRVQGLLNECKKSEINTQTATRRGG